jgi:hypothetical protein
MSWILPVELLPFAGTVALWPLAAILRRPTSRTRLFAEALGTTLAVIGIVWAAWIALWLIEQRW